LVILKSNKQKNPQRKRGRRVKSSSAAKMQNIREHKKTTKDKHKNIAKCKIQNRIDRCKKSFNRVKSANP
jgi:hypothetical protein